MTTKVLAVLSLWRDSESYMERSLAQFEAMEAALKKEGIKTVYGFFEKPVNRKFAGGKKLLDAGGLRFCPLGTDCDQNGWFYQKRLNARKCFSTNNQLPGVIRVYGHLFNIYKRRNSQ